ncbi:scavenger receptor cysteine-rich domain-containing protein SCART1-like isoform X1 [Poecilia latipinna]|uniref:scavenger receptor cysteine-rich domain-containing protein SCART1-like isoform X1 n=1 Tax=Poecilia latipinna TaxID=48699 RepID=UPI00072EA67B|nr:PREDICTED: scavenger receptor cysteine-rich domain-containing protein SCART1-like isoform X1 [Poecilia latipinna]
MKEIVAPHDSKCFQDCVYRDRRLQNCLETFTAGCNVTTEVVCGHQSVRLEGHEDQCAGRVEVWKDGNWGTVCDDRWDLREAKVVCAQLGCGTALRVTGQNGLFPPGSGPIHLDELNCTGNEQNLWFCPGVQENSDCGHKEDAGVVCSESKALFRITTPAPAPPSAVYSPEYIAIILLSILEFLFAILNIFLCCRYFKWHGEREKKRVGASDVSLPAAMQSSV